MEKAEGKAPEPGDAEAVLTHHVTQLWIRSSVEHKMFQKKQESRFLRAQGLHDVTIGVSLKYQE